MKSDKKEVKPKGRLRRPAVIKSPTALQRALARNIRAIREAAGLTQTDLAKRAGSTQTHVSEIEAAARNVTLSMVSRYASALGVSEWDLLAQGPEKPLKP